METLEKNEVIESVMEVVDETVAEPETSIKMTSTIPMVMETPISAEGLNPVETATAEVAKNADDTLKEFINTQQDLIKGLTARISLLERSLKDQAAYINTLNKEIKDAFAHNGKVITGWLGTKDRQIAELKKIGDEVTAQRDVKNRTNIIEDRVQNLEKALHRIQNRVALR